MEVLHKVLEFLWNLFVVLFWGSLAAFIGVPFLTSIDKERRRAEGNIPSEDGFLESVYSNIGKFLIIVFVISVVLSCLGVTIKCLIFRSCGF